MPTTIRCDVCRCWCAIHTNVKNDNAYFNKIDADSKDPTWNFMVRQYVQNMQLLSYNIDTCGLSVSDKV